MSEIVDARGLSCPHPVLLTLNQIQKMKSGEIKILVDSDTAAENVTRLAESKDWTVSSVEPVNDEFEIVINKK